MNNDDDPRRMWRTTLTLAGYDVLEAADGLEALRQLEQNRPDLVVLDLLLPDISGVIVRQEIAAQAHTRDVPVVIATHAGFDASGLSPACVLRKPVSPDQLIVAVVSCLKPGALPVNGQYRA